MKPGNEIGVSIGRIFSRDWKVPCLANRCRELARRKLIKQEPDWPASGPMGGQGRGAEFVLVQALVRGRSFCCSFRCVRLLDVEAAVGGGGQGHV